LIFIFLSSLVDKSSVAANYMTKPPLANTTSPLM